MGELFTLTPAIKGVVRQALDDLITELGKNCLLVYPPLMTPCVNCVVDPIGQKSSGRWTSGGPMPFAEGFVCPMCNGEGFRADVVTETIKMGVAVNPAQFYRKPARGVVIPAGTIQTKAYFTDLGKILRAREMILQPELGDVARWRYALDGDPVDVSNIIQGRYVIATWKRAG